jgi:regulatory protein
VKNPHPTSRIPYFPLTPLEYAYRLLARHAYSEEEIRNKLLTKGFTEAGVTRTVARLKDQGYLDDTRLAADQVERLRAKGYGPEGIRAKLAQKGLPSETIEPALAEEGKEQDCQSAQRLLASRFSADALNNPQTRARAFRLLVRRGYSHEIAETLLGSETDDV